MDALINRRLENLLLNPDPNLEKIMDVLINRTVENFFFDPDPDPT
jgi:hypothetical protein